MARLIEVPDAVAAAVASAAVVLPQAEGGRRGVRVGPVPLPVDVAIAGPGV